MKEKIFQLDAYHTGRLNISERPGFLRTLAALLAHSGDSWFWLLGLLLLWLLGSEYWQLRALIWGSAVAITAGLVLLIKFTIRRQRPKGDWGNVYRKTDPHSFPSGHATRGFLLAVLALGLGPIWLGILLLIWAPIMTFSRVSMGIHYLSDVIAGMVLGSLIAIAILQAASLLI